MMTSSNGNVFRVTGPLWGESTGPGGFPSQRPVTRSFDVFLDLRLNNGWAYTQDAGDLRCHRSHYDVNVMHSQQVWIPFKVETISAKICARTKPESVQCFWPIPGQFWYILRHFSQACHYNPHSSSRFTESWHANHYKKGDILRYRGRPNLSWWHYRS